MPTSTRSPAGSGFSGFPPEALLFYEGLEADNSRAYWSDHLTTYEESVRGPMLALIADLEAGFGGSPGRSPCTPPGSRSSRCRSAAPDRTSTPCAPP